MYLGANTIATATPIANPNAPASVAAPANYSITNPVVFLTPGQTAGTVGGQSPGPGYTVLTGPGAAYLPTAAGAPQTPFSISPYGASTPAQPGNVPVAQGMVTGMNVISDVGGGGLSFNPNFIPGNEAARLFPGIMNPTLPLSYSPLGADQYRPIGDIPGYDLRMYGNPTQIEGDWHPHKFDDLAGIGVSSNANMFASLALIGLIVFMARKA